MNNKDLIEYNNKLYLENIELKNKIIFLNGELSGVSTKYRELQDKLIKTLEQQKKLINQVNKLKQEVKKSHEINCNLFIEIEQKQQEEIANLKSGLTKFYSL